MFLHVVALLALPLLHKMQPLQHICSLHKQFLDILWSHYSLAEGQIGAPI